MSKIAITLGDPASIGAEITLKSIIEGNFDPKDFVLIGKMSALQKTGIPIPEGLEIIEIMPQIEDVETGRIAAVAGEIAYQSVAAACEMAKLNQIRSIVTAPISKEAINLAGHKFSGHTEILEKFLGDEKHKAEMLFVTGNLRVLLLSRHVPIADVPRLITEDLITQKLSALSDELKRLFKIENPKIALCALNPHAGEGGLIGSEEINVLKPAVSKLMERKIRVDGPFPADMLFAKAAKGYREGNQPYDCYAACYHDQGLCAVKALDLGNTVNVTIGLPVLRTSPAHGTAFDIAGKDLADFKSMQSAMKLALELS